MRNIAVLAFLLASSAAVANSAEPITLNLWPGQPPGETKTFPAEADQTKPEDRLIAGRKIIKLGNVSTPQIAVYRPAKEKNTGVSVVIAPGGGHNILAYDLEGTEVAEWLNSIGVTGIVLKYRVPFRDPQKKWLGGVQDAQRAMSIVRSRAAEWELDPKRIGLLGFSAGGEITGMVSLLNERRQYDNVDQVDAVSSRPDFAVLVYAGNLVDNGTGQLRTDVSVTKDAPPMFFAHAYDDRVSPLNALLVAAELKKAGVPAEVHVFNAGGHGYGLRHVDGLPVTDWPKACEAWMKSMSILK